MMTNHMETPAPVSNSNDTRKSSNGTKTQNVNFPSYFDIMELWNPHIDYTFGGGTLRYSIVSRFHQDVLD